MKNNIIPTLPPDENSDKHVHARNKLIRLYNQLREKGGWRAVARDRGSKNQQYIYNFAMRGIVPPNPTERKACFLPARICETCKRPIRAGVKSHEHKEIPAWMKQWRKLSKETRDNLIREWVEKVTGA